MSDYILYTDELNHFGVLGMKWGVRRYQNMDGTLNSAGRKRYRELSSKRVATAEKRLAVENKKTALTARYNTVGHAKQEARTAKLTAKRNALEPKVSKLQRRMLKGKEPGFFGKRTLNKAYKLDKAIAKSSRAKTKYDAQMSKLDVKATKLEKRIAKYNRQINKLDKAQMELGKQFADAYKSMTPKQLDAYRREHAKDSQAYLNETRKQFNKTAFDIVNASERADRDARAYQIMREGRNLIRENPGKRSPEQLARVERNLAAQKEKAQKSSDAFVEAAKRGHALYTDIETEVNGLKSGPYDVTTRGEGRHKKYRVRYKGAK